MSLVLDNKKGTRIEIFIEIMDFIPYTSIILEVLNKKFPFVRK
jgi:hypothetical protein